MTWNEEITEMTVAVNSTFLWLEETNWTDVPYDSGLSPAEANSSTEYVPYYTRPETYIVPVVFAIIFVVGVLGNGTLIIVFLRHRAMRNVPNT